MLNRLLILGAFALGIAVLPGTVMAQRHQQGDLPGPIDNVQDLQDTAKMLFKMADTNNDGQISQKEAVDVGNLLVGGFFFRADANGDGVLEPQEAQAAREQLFRQQPLLRYVFEKARPQNAGAVTPGDVRNQPPDQAARNIAANPVKAIGNLLDTNHNQKIEAAELRQAVQQGVQMLFQVADANQDGQLSPAELNRAVGEAARTATQVAFQTADTDRNGAISMEEFDKALTEPAHAAFRVLDANNDGQLSLDELQRAQQVIANQIMRLQVPEPANSPLRSSRAARRPPRSVSPAPSPRRPPPPSGREREGPSVFRHGPTRSLTGSRRLAGLTESPGRREPLAFALTAGPEDSTTRARPAARARKSPVRRRPDRAHRPRIHLRTTDDSPAFPGIRHMGRQRFPGMLDRAGHGRGDPAPGVLEPIREALDRLGSVPLEPALLVPAQQQGHEEPQAETDAEGRHDRRVGTLRDHPPDVTRRVRRPSALVGAPGLMLAAELAGVPDPRVAAVRGVHAARVIPPGHVMPPLPSGQKGCVRIPSNSRHCRAKGMPGAGGLGPRIAPGHGVCEAGSGSIRRSGR